MTLGISTKLGNYPTFRACKVSFLIKINEDGLKTLNNLTQTCSEEWVLDQNSCPSESTLTCRAINTTQSFDSTRECLETPNQAHSQFDLLRNSYLSQSSLMDTMIQSLTGSSSDSPLTNVSQLTPVPPNSNYDEFISQRFQQHWFRDGKDFRFDAGIQGGLRNAVQL